VRVPQTIVAAVPVGLMNRDSPLHCRTGGLVLSLRDDRQLEIVARNRGISAKEGESAAKLLTAFLCKAEESVVGRLIVEAVILLSAKTQSDGGKVSHIAARL
jgi:ParB family chromosome partitioning protein